MRSLFFASTLLVTACSAGYGGVGIDSRAPSPSETSPNEPVIGDRGPERDAGADARIPGSDGGRDAASAYGAVPPGCTAESVKGAQDVLCLSKMACGADEFQYVCFAAENVTGKDCICHRNTELVDDSICAPLVAYCIIP